MNLLDNEEIKPIMERLELQMLEYITPGETVYNEKDVDQCIQIMIEYLKDVALSTSKEEGMKVVVKTVFAPTI